MRVFPDQCSHASWYPVPTPYDSSSRWYRCRRCKVYGFKRSNTAKPYKCGHDDCRRHAVDRLPGRAARMGMKWRCGLHMGEAIAAGVPTLAATA